MRALPARGTRDRADGLDARGDVFDRVHGRCPRAAPPGCWRKQFLPRVRELLRQVGVLHVDETPARADGALELRARRLHRVPDRDAHRRPHPRTDIDAGKVLPGYTGTIVRDGYAGYTHLIDAHHAWCGAHLLRDLAAFHRADPDGQFWAAAMADTLIDAHHARPSRPRRRPRPPHPPTSWPTSGAATAAPPQPGSATTPPAPARWPATRSPSRAASATTRT